MLNKRQLKLIKTGSFVWNKWRDKNPKRKVNLFRAKLDGINLARINLVGADLTDANLTGTNLTGADLTGADLSDADLSGTDLFYANLNLANLSGTDLGHADFNQAKLQNADLTCADLNGAIFHEADLTGAVLKKVIVYEADFRRVILSDADLSGAILQNVNFSGAYLSGANLCDTNLSDVNFKYADLRGANLCGAFLYRANLSDADLTGANLTGADLTGASLIGTNLEGAILSNCKIYGLSAWGLKGVPKDQLSLIITPDGEAEITVDDLQVAQFIYLLLNNKNVRNVIDTITSKAVLILGRFTPQRKEVLDLIREELHKHDYVPILFDFENTESQSLVETVMTLAGMARFIIADVTAATMVREELRSVVEKYPAKPIQPILLNGEQEYVTLPEIRMGFKNILPTFTYKDTSEVITELSAGIITPAENWLKARKAQLLSGGKTEREVELEKEVEALRNQLQKKFI